MKTLKLLSSFLLLYSYLAGAESLHLSIKDSPSITQGLTQSLTVECDTPKLTEKCRVNFTGPAPGSGHIKRQVFERKLKELIDLEEQGKSPDASKLDPHQVAMKVEVKKGKLNFSTPLATSFAYEGQNRANFKRYSQTLRELKRMIILNHEPGKKK